MNEEKLLLFEYLYLSKMYFSIGKGNNMTFFIPEINILEFLAKLLQKSHLTVDCIQDEQNIFSS